MCDPILVTLLKMQPHYSQSSRENVTPSSNTSPIASYKEILPTRGDSTLMTRHYKDLGSAFDRSCSMGNLPQPIRSTVQIWVVMCHQYGIFAFVSQTSFRGETSSGVTKCRLFSQAIFKLTSWN